MQPNIKYICNILLFSLIVKTSVSYCACVCFSNVKLYLKAGLHAMINASNLSYKGIVTIYCCL